MCKLVSIRWQVGVYGNLIHPLYILTENIAKIKRKNWDVNRRGNCLAKVWSDWQIPANSAIVPDAYSTLGNENWGRLGGFPSPGWLPVSR